MKRRKVRTKIYKEEVVFKNYAGIKYAVYLDNKGNRVTWRKLKGSGIKSREDAYNLISTTGTFYPDRIKISRNKPRIAGVEAKILYIGSKAVNVTKAKVRSSVAIGKKALLVRSKNPISKYKNYQYVCRLEFRGYKSVEGYSNLVKPSALQVKRYLQMIVDRGETDTTYEHGTEQQALGRAKQEAIRAGIISYDWYFKFKGEGEGVAVSPKGHEIEFKYSFEVQTYIGTEE